MDTNLLSTQRLELRMWNIEDAKLLVDLCRAEGFDDYSTGRFSNMNLEQAKVFIQEEQECYRIHGFGRLGIYLHGSRTPVGICCLYKMTDPSFIGTIGIAYRLPKEHWGHGYAAEVASALLDYGFKSLNLKSISAIIDPNNFRSQRVVEKIGMKFVEAVRYKGELRQHWICSNIFEISEHPSTITC